MEITNKIKLLENDIESLNPWNHPICFAIPDRLTTYSAWHEHIPFAMFLVDLLMPRTIVELGTYYGDSYCAFCQAVKELRLNTACYAVDTWEGDLHNGLYGAEVLADLKRYHDALYGNFSTLIQSTFDEASAHFADGTIDLLHIDGYHIYEVVRHDFETWLPKMSQHGVVLFHDTNVVERDYGVRKFWHEVKVRYPHFEFLHGHGLGVLSVDIMNPTRLFMLSDNETTKMSDFFFQFGNRLTLKVKNSEMTMKMEGQTREIEQMQREIEQMQRSIPVRIANRYQTMYRLGLASIRVILNEGWRSLFRKVWDRLK